MRTISLELIKVKGFKSFAKETIIELSKTPGFKFLTGLNLVQERLGANGAGKSSCWDAVFWCLYGISIRGKRTSELVSWEAESADVETTWRIGKRLRRVRRTSSPPRMYIDDKSASQEQIEELIGLSREEFLNSVIFGQGNDLFFDKSVPDRGVLLSEVMKLDYWLNLSDKCSKEQSNLQKQIEELRLEEARLAGSLENTDALKQAREQQNTWENDRKQRLEAAIVTVEEAESELQTLQENTVTKPSGDTLKLFAERLDSIASTILELSRKVAASSREIDLRQRDLDFYAHSDTCPTCKQDIDAAFAKVERKKLRAKLDELKTANSANANRIIELEVKSDVQKQLRKAEQTKFDAALSEHQEHQRELKSLNETINRATTLAERVGEEKNPWIKRVKDQVAAIATARAEIANLRTEIAEIAGKADCYEYWKNGFKRLRLFLMKRALAMLELEAAYAARTLGLSAWKIAFSTEIETKSGSLRAGVHIQVVAGDEYKSREWSPGELQRVRLAVQIGLAAMIQRRAGVYYDLEVLDEPSSWLSAEGIEDLLNFLKQRSVSLNKSIWLVDHRALAYPGFDEVWKATKTIDGTTIAKEGA